MDSSEIDSCSDTYYSLSDFDKVQKFDSHVHLNSENTALIEQAILDKFRILSITTDVPGFPEIDAQDGFAMQQKICFPGKVNYLTSFTLANWNSPHWAEQTISKLKANFEDGATGVKIWKNIGMDFKDSKGRFVMIDNPKFDPVFDYIRQQGKSVLGHLGEPKNCWLPVNEMTVNNDKKYFEEHPEYHMFLHYDFASYEQQIEARDRFLERHPGLKFVGAHLGSLEWSIDELAKRLEKYPDFAVDLASRTCHLQFQSQGNREEVRHFMIKYQDRILYASDSGFDALSVPKDFKNKLHNLWINDWKYFVTDEKMTAESVAGEFQGLRLPKTVIDKIFYHNTQHWFKIK